jgi:hypothetical protein
MTQNPNASHKDVSLAFPEIPKGTISSSLFVVRHKHVSVEVRPSDDDMLVSVESFILNVKKLISQNKRLREALIGLHEQVDRVNGAQGNQLELCVLCHATTYGPDEGVHHNPSCQIPKARAALSQQEAGE